MGSHSEALNHSGASTILCLCPSPFLFLKDPSTSLSSVSLDKGLLTLKPQLKCHRSPVVPSSLWPQRYKGIVKCSVIPCTVVLSTRSNVHCVPSLLAAPANAFRGRLCLRCLCVIGFSLMCHECTIHICEIEVSADGRGEPLRCLMQKMDIFW